MNGFSLNWEKLPMKWLDMERKGNSERFFGLDKLNSFRKTHNSTVRTTVLEKLIHYEQFDWN
jgi:hypothetical protein